MDYINALKDIDSRLFELEKRSISDMDRDDLEKAYLDLLKRYLEQKYSEYSSDEDDEEYEEEDEEDYE